MMFMLNGVFLQAYGYYGGVIGDMLNKWAEMGFFSYLLPFLLIFAMVYGVLSSMQIFKENRAIDGVIALSIGLLALQFEFVPVFFSEVFPRLGVGLAVLLVLIILGGFFIDPKKAGIMYTMLGIGVVIAIIVLVKTSGAVGWSSGQWWGDNWEMVAGGLFILILIAIITGGSNKGNPPSSSAGYTLSPWRANS
ncbi:MAG: hypothetical protein KKA64_01930 [Nanoarchaeota archaeon]|nr:hypothetical protein [Nanoarchaeota archaeon]